MTNINSIILKFREIFEKDRTAMYYHGEFDDRFTDKLISIADYEVEKKTKRRMAFLISESFQNIIRHGENDILEENTGLFGIRGRDPYLSIYSSNLISEESKRYLDSNISNLNNLNDEALKEHYRQVLSEGRINEKGGAGLGLIEMAKKSRRPMQMEFHNQPHHNIYSFNLQIDLVVDEEKDLETDVLPADISSNTPIYDLIVDNNIMFVYKGEFSEELITPLINLLESNTKVGNDSMAYKIYTTGIEMMQNISSHASGSRPRRDGLFVIIHADGGYYLATGNYIDGDGQELISRADRLNHLNKEELDQRYREVLKNSIQEQKKNANVGLIDIRRMLMNNIDVSVESVGDGNYLIMGVEITAEHESVGI